MTYNKTVKAYIDKWRQSHREQHNAYLYIKNKEYCETIQHPTYLLSLPS